MTVVLAMGAVPAVHEQMHERAGQDQAKRQHGQHVGRVRGEQVEGDTIRPPSTATPSGELNQTARWERP
jgi:hypothetical protein